MRVTGYEVNVSFRKWSKSDNGVHRSKWSTSFIIINMICVTLLDYKNAISKHGWPKLTSSQNILGGGIAIHMSTTCSNITFVQYFLSLLMSEAPSEYRSNTTTI